MYRKECTEYRAIERPLEEQNRESAELSVTMVNAANWVSSCSAPNQAPVVVQVVYNYGLWRGEVGTATFVYSSLNDNLHSSLPGSDNLHSPLPGSGKNVTDVVLYHLTPT